MGESLPDWDALRVLLAIAEAGSLRRAAARLACSQPTLGRRIRELEESLGHPLLIRHARGVELTDEGRAVLEVARGIEERLGGLQRGLAGRLSTVAGRVRVSCTESVAIELLPPILRDLRERHPKLGVDVVVDAHASDLDRREADLAIRMFQPRRASLVARRLGATFTGFYASRSYLARRGRPEQLSDLREHEMIGPDRDPMFVGMVDQLGFPVEALAFRTDSFACTLAWTRAGLGIGALVGAVVRDEPELVQVLEPLNQYPVWLVTHPDLFGSVAVRAVWDALVGALSPVFAREA